MTNGELRTVYEKRPIHVLQYLALNFAYDNKIKCEFWVTHIDASVYPVHIYWRGKYSKWSPSRSRFKHPLELYITDEDITEAIKAWDRRVND